MPEDVVAKEETTTSPAIPAERRGYQNYDFSKAILPRVRLNGKMGVFESNLDDNDGTANLVIVPIFMSRSRTLFVPEENSTDRLCQSANGAVPTWFSPGFWENDKPPNTCESCPHSRWNAKDGKTTKPNCAESWNFLAVDPGNPDSPFIFTVSGTAITVANRMMTMLSRLSPDLFCAEVAFGNHTKGEGKKQYFKLTLDSHRILSDEEMAVYEKLYDSYVGGNPLEIADIMGGGSRSQQQGTSVEAEPADGEEKDEVPF